MRAIIQELLVYILYPLWLLAGALDYWLHRASHIETTSGTTESWLHLAQFLTLSIALLLAGFFQITVAALVLLLVIVSIHSLLAYLDVSYTIGRRPISAFEQLIHGYLDLIPIFAVLLLAVMHWDQVQLRVWSLRPREPSGLSPELLMLWASFVLLAGLPILHELWRTGRPDLSASPT